MRIHSKSSPVLNMELPILFWLLCFSGFCSVLCSGNFYQLLKDDDDFKVVQTKKNVLIDGSFAVARYEKGVHKTGWDYLDIRTNKSLEDGEAAFAAGFLEGFLTADLVYDHYGNTMSDFCTGRQSLCDKLIEFLGENLQWMHQQVESHQNDEYWYQVGLIFEQLHSLRLGYNLAQTDPAKKFKDEFFWMNYQSDFEDLVEAIKVTQFGFHLEKDYLPPSARGVGHCSALIKLVPGSNLYVAQDTWNTYQSMLRLQKRYSLPYLRRPGQKDKIPGATMTMSSYPGSVTSGDDFYLISSGLATLETTIGNGNASLWQHVKPTGQVPEWIRSLVANRLATDGKSWSDIFKRYNSGTYNNQWMVVDYKKFDPLVKPSNLPDGLLWVVEQIPSLIVAEDGTENLRKDTYWPSYNVAAFPAVFNLSGNQEMVKKFGDWFTYERNPRALIFKRDQGKVRDLKTMFNLMRYNDYQHDPLSRCNCDPPYSAENSIAARCDMNPKNGTYLFPALGHRQHGATDAKITSVELFSNNLSFLAISGPVHSTASGIPPFQWSTSDFGNTTRHVGHPDLWTFQPVVYLWGK